jgi:hypothetical protein
MRAFWEIFLTAYGVAWLVLGLVVAIAATWEAWFGKGGGDGKW